MSEPEGDRTPYRRWWKIWPSSPCLPCNSALHPCRTSVSKNKIRFHQDGFDLDLTYITKRIIVHGFPAVGIEAIYRNPRMEVQRLLEKYHEDHYKVYNFTNEPGRAYPSHLFQGRVERYPFSDHTCPPLESVVDFCESAKAWLDADEKNVVSLHCKAGKGRAGIMAACLMVRLGDTAEEAINKYDSTRVSDMQGLTVVNQRKWTFLYERLIKEVWGLRGGIGMVPGQDPDLRAPKPRVTYISEISVQLQLETAMGKRNEGLLPNLSCALYQQDPMGKVLMHKANLERVVPVGDEPGVMYAVSLPRGAEVEGTFEVIFSAAKGPSAMKRDVMDLWWNTTFLAPEGGDQAFELQEMDVSPMKLKIRLEQASARVVLRHVPPQAPSPERHTRLNRRGFDSEKGGAPGAGASGAAPPAPDDAREEEQQPGAQAPPTGGGEIYGMSRADADADGACDGSIIESEAAKQEDTKSPRDHGDISWSVDQTATEEAKTVTGTTQGGATPLRPQSQSQSEPRSPALPLPLPLPSPSPSLPAEDGALGEDSKEGSSFTGGPSPASAFFDGASPASDFSDMGPSPASALPSRGLSSALALPGPSPAGGMSPAWTFDGRMHSSELDNSARPVEDSREGQPRMWTKNSISKQGVSQGVSESGAWTPLGSVSRRDDATIPIPPPPPPPGAYSNRRAEGLRSKRRAAALKNRPELDSVSIGSDAARVATGAISGQNASYLVSRPPTAGKMGVQTAMGTAMANTKGAWSSLRQDGIAGAGSSRFPRQHETDSESEDQVAVRASGFGKGRWRLGGVGVDGSETEALLGDAPQSELERGPATGSSSTKGMGDGEQWVTDVEMAFASERRKWEEHRQCLESELDWALAARARAEARSEEDSARVEVLESRLAAWRSEYSVIERDVKQAVKLLEMSLSGLISAEKSLRRWKDQIPQQAYEDILFCLTKGDAEHERVDPGRE